MRPRKTLQVAGILIAVTALAACSQGVPPEEAMVRPEVTFEMAQESILFESDSPDWVGVDGLLARNDARYGDFLVLSAPDAVLKEASRRYAPLGLHVVAGSAPNKAIFQRTVVIAPECERWANRTHTDVTNQPAANHGCASLSNLARMVADPNDLIAGRAAPDGQDPALGVRAIGQMRAGQLQIRTTSEGSTTTGG